MPTTDCLSVASRRRIYECVTTNPGAHLRDVARRCDMPLGTSLYHLDYLEQAGLIVSRRDGRYKRYFGSHSMGRREKEVLSVLRHDAPRRLVTALLERGASTQRDLCASVGVSRSTVSFHLARLVTEGVVARVPRRPEALYEVTEAQFTQDLLSRFAASLAHAPEASLAVPIPVQGQAETSALVG
ncbi:MAG TPA: winged helix-turn-helix transcriptional regulator [Candidatus Thermoplasmatota archaeon]|nr:winged helix-turn-helix transcriptional regulator [Candidatus Thermoplasmatota archaeon]